MIFLDKIFELMAWISNALFSFSTYTGQVIKAWDIAVMSMQRGEVCMLLCKPEYAYGSAGNPPKVSPNSPLLFEVGISRLYIMAVVFVFVAWFHNGSVYLDHTQRTFW